MEQDVETGYRALCSTCLSSDRDLFDLNNTAQDIFRLLMYDFAGDRSMDHTYMSQSLSCLEMETKTEYDKIFFDFSTGDEGYIIQTQPQNVKNEHFDVSHVQDTNILDIDEHILEEKRPRRRFSMLAQCTNGKKKKDKDAKEQKDPPKPGDLRKLLSKTSIEGYQCLECDMFFKNSRARKNHVARFHREGLQCDHCKKRFVNRTTLATHLK
ncbi:hypothetical protein HF086_015762 [Spodoptera exigua]|uniref:C2H2-type domain-containing protein n=1 Tax=Spodoptera exigua TaxID=7107 RepID=A0A922S8J2_SPOEX|nr:hypothetical protein HF086_015762 [Spodoptera exigua]